MKYAPLQDIKDVFGLPNERKTAAVPKELVVKWMTSDDLESLGALHAFLSKAKHLKRVSPNISREEMIYFKLRYFEKCLHLDMDGEWAHGRYAAAWDVAAWFDALWKRGPAEGATLTQIKAWLAHIYKGADEELRRCIIGGALEHMFESNAVQNFFSDWKADPVLSIAFAEAFDWSGKRP